MGSPGGHRWDGSGGLPMAQQCCWGRAGAGLSSGGLPMAQQSWGRAGATAELRGGLQVGSGCPALQGRRAEQAEPGWLCCPSAPHSDTEVGV